MELVYVVALATLGCFALFSYSVYRFSAIALEAISALEKNSAFLAQVKGLSPHVVDPEKFAPVGKSWDAVEQERIKTVRLQRINSLRGKKQEYVDALRIMTERGDDARAIGITQEKLGFIEKELALSNA